MTGVSAAGQKRLYVNKYARRGSRHFRRSSGKVSTKKRVYRNSKAIGKLKHYVRSQRVYTDWSLSGTFLVPPNTWFIQPLTGPGDWSPWGRQSEAVIESKKTQLVSARIYFSGFMTDQEPLAVNVFIVTPASASASRNPFVTGPQNVKDYIISSDQQVINLNRQVFRVISQRSLLLSNTSPGGGVVVPAAQAGNPNTTWFKYNTGYKTNFPYKQAIGDINPAGDYVAKSWRNHQIEDLPYSHRMYMMIFVGGGGHGLSFNWHQTTVCMNSD